MDWFTNEPLACYVFDRGYFDLARLYRINAFGAFFIIREKGKPAYEIVDGESILDGIDNVLKDQSIRFTKKENKEKYPGVIRRIVYYASELQRSFVYYTNNFYLEAKDIALLYKCRWQVELFFYDKYFIMQSKVRSKPDNQRLVSLLLTFNSHNNSQRPRSLSQSRRSLLFSHSLSEPQFGTRSAYAFSRASRLTFESALA